MRSCRLWTVHRGPINARPELENLFDPGFAQHIPRHILVVEDNPVNQIVIRRLLERLGYATDIADCGQSALTAIHERAYDLIFMDMQMPDMDGLETSRRIRQLEQTAKPARPQATIVALTANVQPEDRAVWLAAGMDDYVSKPIQITELRQVISERHTRVPSSRNDGQSLVAGGERLAAIGTNNDYVFDDAHPVDVAQKCWAPP